MPMGQSVSNEFRKAALPSIGLTWIEPLAYLPPLLALTTVTVSCWTHLIRFASIVVLTCAVETDVAPIKVLSCSGVAILGVDSG